MVHHQHSVQTNHCSFVKADNCQHFCSNLWLVVAEILRNLTFKCFFSTFLSIITGNVTGLIFFFLVFFKALTFEALNVFLGLKIQKSTNNKNETNQINIVFLFPFIYCSFATHMNVCQEFRVLVHFLRSIFVFLSCTASISTEKRSGSRQEVIFEHYFFVVVVVALLFSTCEINNKEDQMH